MLCLTVALAGGASPGQREADVLGELTSSVYIVAMGDACQKMEMAEEDYKGFITQIAETGHDVLKLNCSAEASICKKLELGECPSIVYVGSEGVYPYVGAKPELPSLIAWKAVVESNDSVLRWNASEKEL